MFREVCYYPCLFRKKNFADIRSLCKTWYKLLRITFFVLISFPRCDRVFWAEACSVKKSPSLLFQTAKKTLSFDAKVRNEFTPSPHFSLPTSSINCCFLKRCKCVHRVRPLFHAFVRLITNQKHGRILVTKLYRIIFVLWESHQIRLDFSFIMPNIIEEYELEWVLYKKVFFARDIRKLTLLYAARVNKLMVCSKNYICGHYKETISERR